MADGTTIGKAYVQIVPSAKGFSQSIKSQLGGEGSGLAGVGKNLGNNAAQSAGTSFVGKLKGILAAAGIGAVVVKVLKSAFEEGSRYQQSVGGIETLFGAGGKSVQEYARSVGKSVGSVKGKYKELMKAQALAMKNASQSYKTAGLSASEYMDTITSFAAALKTSTKNETEAAKVGNMAVVDMSDNANKMGTNMQDIQNAYQGFAKQNYTMLDNLKLGYSGSKTGMQELLKDATKLSGVKYDISNLSDVYKAIHVIQTNLGITGTTAREAATTMSGSFNMFKASLKDVGAQIATGGDVSGSVQPLLESTGPVLQNALPMLVNIVKGIVLGIGNAITKGIPELGKYLSKHGPAILAKGKELAGKLGDGIKKGFHTILSKAPGLAGKLTGGITKAIVTKGPSLIKTGFEIINKIIKGIGKAVPQIIKTIPKIINNMVHKFNETDWNKVGKRMVNEIKKGIDNIGKNLPQTMKKIGLAMVKAFKNTDWKGVGKAVLTVLKLTLMLGVAILKGVGKLIGKALLAGLKLGWTGIKTLGKNLIKGLWNGIKDMAGWIKSKIQGFGKGVLDALKSFFGIHSPSRVMRDQVGVMIGRGIAVGIEASTKNAKKSATAQGKAILAAYKKNLSTYKKTHDVGIADEAKYWKAILKKAKKGTSLYKEVSILYSAAQKKVTDNLKKNLSEAKKSYASSAKEVINAYKQTAKELQSSYKSLVSERKESIVSAFDPFSEWQTNESSMDGAHLLLNLENFRIAQTQWAQAMAELKTRIGDGKLYDYMSALGPKALTQVQDLLSLSQDQLKKYNDMYHQMRASAGDEAKEELTSELADTNKKIAEASKKAQSDLNKPTKKLKKTVEGFGGSIKAVKPDIEKQGRVLGNAFAQSFQAAIQANQSSIYSTIGALVATSAAASKSISSMNKNVSTDNSKNINNFNITSAGNAVATAAAIGNMLAKQTLRKKRAKGK